MQRSGLGQAAGKPCRRRRFESQNYSRTLISPCGHQSLKTHAVRPWTVLKASSFPTVVGLTETSYKAGEGKGSSRRKQARQGKARPGRLLRRCADARSSASSTHPPKTVHTISVVREENSNDSTPITFYETSTARARSNHDNNKLTGSAAQPSHLAFAASDKPTHRSISACTSHARRGRYMGSPT